MAMNNGNGSSNSKEKKRPSKLSDKSTKHLGMSKIPLINDFGACSKCTDETALDYCATCHICKQQFHAACLDTKGSHSPEAICSRSFYNMFKQVSVKYGANASRWGNICFICDACNISLNKNIQCSTDENSSQTESFYTDCSYSDGNVCVDIPATTAESSIDQMKVLLEGMKDDILLNVNRLIDEKMAPHISAHTPTQNPTNVNAPVIQSPGTAPTFSDVVAQNAPPPIRTKVNSSIESADEIPLHDPTVCNDVIVLTSSNSEIDFNLVEKAIENDLKNIPVNFIEIKRQSCKILVGFPTSLDKNAGTEKLSTCSTIQAYGFAINEPKKMLPKVTLSNVPSYLISHIPKNIPKDDYRQKVKDHLKSLLMNKNSDLQEKIESIESCVFEIVYVNVGQNYVTLGIKVSPSLRNFMISQSKLFIGNTSCTIVDRFHIKQCFKCQKIGHISTACPEPNRNSVCMYCSASHSTRECPNKSATNLHRCRNCALSKNNKVLSGCNTHHSSSPSCPIIQREQAKQKLNTQYSKN